MAALEGRKAGLFVYAEVLCGEQAGEALEAAIAAVRYDLDHLDAAPCEDPRMLLTIHTRRATAARMPEPPPGCVSPVTLAALQVPRELSREERGHVRDHLLGCRACSATAAHLKSAERLLKTCSSLPAPKWLYSAVPKQEVTSPAAAPVPAPQASIPPPRPAPPVARRRAVPRRLAVAVVLGAVASMAAATVGLNAVRGSDRTAPTVKVAGAAVPTAEPATPSAGRLGPAVMAQAAMRRARDARRGAIASVRRATREKKTAERRRRRTASRRRAARRRPQLAAADRRAPEPESQPQAQPVEQTPQAIAPRPSPTRSPVRRSRPTPPSTPPEGPGRRAPNHDEL